MTPSSRPGPFVNLNRDLDRLEEIFSPSAMETIPFEERRKIMGKLSRWLRNMHAVYSIGIITALSKEFAAVNAMINDSKVYSALPGDPNIYCVGTIPALAGNGNAKHHVVVTQLAKIGNNSAASAAADLLRSFPDVRDVLVVGIAGGVPDPGKPEVHVRLGDVVVSRDRGVVQYDMRKVEPGKIEVRDTSTPPSARMIRVVNLLEARRLAGEYPWEQHIDRGRHIEGATRPDERTDILHDAEDPSAIVEHPDDPTRRRGQPKIHYGLIGSANTLLKDPRLRNHLRDTYKVRAIEMEGSGIADGTWNHAAQYILIRGICDYCDVHKNDVWQGYAAVAAAAYARALVEAVLPDL
jgi:nucleoside phosphorylase